MTIYYVEDDIEFYNREKRKKRFKTFNHFHNCHEIFYLVSGTTRYIVGDEIYIMSAGDMVFVPKGVFHQNNSEQNEAVERILIEFDDDYLDDDFKDMLDELRQNRHVRFQASKRYKIENLFAKIEKEASSREAFYPKMYKLYLNELLVLISRYRLNDITGNTQNSASLTDKIERYIGENIDNDLSLEVLAQKCFLSPNHLSRQFKKLTGVPLSEYINISRVAYAEKLLQDSNMSIRDVAIRCGFNDSSYFAYIFKKYRGITPKKYAAQKKKSN